MAEVCLKLTGWFWLHAQTTCELLDGIALNQVNSRLRLPGPKFEDHTSNGGLSQNCVSGAFAKRMLTCSMEA